MTELILIAALYLIAAALAAIGVYLVAGPGACLITISIFALAAARLIAKGAARVPHA